MVSTAQMIAKSLTTNRITKDDKNFHVSYNPSSVDYGCPTTALYINKTSQFLILCGRHDFKECVTLDDHVKYFYDNIDQVNHRSEHGTVFRFKDNKASYEKGGY